VLLDLSHFLIGGLERLDMSYLKEDISDANPQEQLKGFAPQSTIRFLVNDTLFVLENPEVSEKCVVLQVSLNMILKSADPNQIIEHLREDESQTVS
jgi:hypothetical protein